MATFDRPSMVPTWAENNQTNVDQPPDSLRAVGYVADEVPMAEHLNWLFWSLGNWVGYLDQANAATVMATTLDVNTRLVGGGTWSYDANSKTLAWDMAAGLLIPSIPLSDNAIAAGSVILGDNVVAYVQANVPYTTSGALKSGDAYVRNVAHPAAISVGWTVTGTGIPDNTTVTAINDSTLTLSQAATATNGTAVLTFAGNTALTVQAAPAASFLPNPNTVIIAIGRQSHAIVGANSGQMMLRHNERKMLLGSGYVSSVTALAGQSLAANTPVYISQGSSDSRTSGSLYACEAGSANGAQRGQFIGFVPNAYATGDSAHVVSAGIVNGFSNLTVGQVYYLDPSNTGAITTTRPTAVGTFVVPIGCAITSTSLRINPAATNALQAIQSGQTVNGFLIVRPGATGNAVQVYSADGTTQTAAITDAGAASFSQMTASGPVSGSTVTSGSGFKSYVDMGGINFSGTSGTASSFARLAANSGGGVALNDPFWTPIYDGSLVGFTISINLSVAASIFCGVFGPSSLVSQTFNNVPAGQNRLTFKAAKGAFPFTANQNLRLAILPTTNGGTSLNYVANGGLFIELPA